MRGRVWIVALAAVAALGWFGRGALSDDEPKPEGGDPGAGEKQMEELAKPGEMHAWLAKFDGAWDVSGEFVDASGATMRSKGTATFRMTLGGRWSEQSFSGVFRDQQMEGRGLTGFDNLKKQYVNYWYDTLSTSCAPATGSRSADGKSMTLSGEWEMPGRSVPFQYVTTWVDDKTFTFRMIMDLQGQKIPVGTLTYTRK